MASPLSPAVLQLYSQQTDYTIFGCSWIPASARLITVGMRSNGAGPITVWSMPGSKGAEGDSGAARAPGGQMHLQKTAEYVKGAALKCVSFNASIHPKRQFSTGDHKGYLYLYDIEQMSRPLFSVKAHENMINCVDGVGGKDPMKYGAPEIATGSSDGAVKVWDVRRNTPVVVFTPDEDSVVSVGNPGRPEDGVLRIYPECWAVAFGGSYNVYDRWVAMGYDNGDLKILDLRASRVIYEHHFPNGICSLEFDRQDIRPNKLVVATLQGHIYILDLKTLHPEQGFAILDVKPFGAASSSTLWSVRHNPMNRDVFLTSSGGRLGLLRYEYPAERSRTLEDGSSVGVVGKCSVVCDAPFNEQAINTISWNRDKNGLIAWSAMDQTINLGFVTNLKSLE